MYMQLTAKQAAIFLLSFEGIGAAFVGIYSLAYMLGLPSTAVLHSDPVFRTTLSVLGVLLVVLVLCAVAVAFLVKHRE
jgi:hypothetical protein